MTAQSQRSELQIQKQRLDATLRLTNGDSLLGRFFLSMHSPRHSGQERVADVLNATETFFPFEIDQPDGGRRTVLLNRAHVVAVTLSQPDVVDEVLQTMGTLHHVAMALVNGQRLKGVIRVIQRKGYTRLSDWTRQPDQFQYVETPGFTFVVNLAHIVEISETTPETEQ